MKNIQKAICDKLLNRVEALILEIQDNKIKKDPIRFKNWSEEFLKVEKELNQLGANETSYMDQKFSEWFKEVIVPKHKDIIDKVNRNPQPITPEMIKAILSQFSS